MTNHPHRATPEPHLLTSAEVVDLATLSVLRKAAAVGKYHDEQRSAVLDIVRAARGAEQ